MTITVSRSQADQDNPAQRASGSSFYTAMRILPKAERDAMVAIYAFCRAVDDIADEGPGSRGDRRAALDRWREDIGALYRGETPSRAAALAGPIDRFGLRKADFLSVIDGMEMDVAADIVAPDLATLDLYCDRVASAVGRLSVKIFGMPDEPGTRLAHHLGRALQLTNILRDIDEDAAMGRLYLPREALIEAGLPLDASLQEIIENASIDAACQVVCKIAHEHYRQADLVFNDRPGGHILAPRLMRAAYRSILEKMCLAGWAPPRARMRVGKSKLLWLALREGLFG
jgi:phytoene synthase